MVQWPQQVPHNFNMEQDQIGIQPALSRSLEDHILGSPQAYQNILKLVQLSKEAGANAWTQHIGSVTNEIPTASSSLKSNAQPSSQSSASFNWSMPTPLSAAPGYLSPERQHTQSGSSLDGLMTSPAPSDSTVMSAHIGNEDAFLQSVLEELQQAQQYERRRPPSAYRCHVCNSNEHYIRDCPMRKNTETLGVYQGTRQSVGKFKCINCRKEWTSKRCFANCEQKCRKCQSINRPTKMYSMEKAVELGLISLEDANQELKTISPKRF